MDLIDDDGIEAHRSDAPAGLFLSRRGVWYHDGDRVRHAGLEALLHRSIARAADDSLLVTTGLDELPFTAEDAPMFVRTLGREPQSQDVTLELADGTTEPLGSRTLFIDDVGRIRCPVRHGDFWALLSRTATQVILSFLDGQGLVSTHAGPCALEPVSPTDWSRRPT